MQDKEITNNKFEHGERDIRNIKEHGRIEVEIRAGESGKSDERFCQGKRDIIGKNAKIPVSPVIPDAGHQSGQGQEHHDAHAVEVQGQEAEKFHRWSFGQK